MIGFRLTGEGRLLSLCIDLPMYPKECAPNRRRSLRGQISARGRFRDWAAIAAKEALGAAPPPRWGACRVDVDAFFTARRTRDRDNIIAALKGGFDGLTVAGIWADDSRVRIGDVNQHVDPKRPRIELRVTPLL